MMDFEHWYANEGSWSEGRQVRWQEQATAQQRLRLQAQRARTRAAALQSRARCLRQQTARTREQATCLRRPEPPAAREQRLIEREQAITLGIEAAEQRKRDRIARWREEAAAQPTQEARPQEYDRPEEQAEQAERAPLLPGHLSVAALEEVILVFAAALELANMGRLADGYTLLLDALEVAQTRCEMGEGSADDLASEFRMALEHYCEWFGVRAE